MENTLQAPAANLTAPGTSLSVPATGVSGTARPRLDGIDFLRGLVMVIMVLDHARDFFGGGQMDPRDVNDTALFLTRWITHFCAPVFVFLAGVSAFLYGTRGRSTSEIARFTLTRGLWLILVEVTLVRLGWTFNLDFDFIFLQVIWVIGVSLVALSGLVYLPRWAIGTFGLLLILGHNALDGILPTDFGAHAWLWMFLHSTGSLQLAPGVQLLVIYPVIPWIAVMALGYAIGPVMMRPESERRRILLALGIAAVVGFIALRATNLYGDPRPWSVQQHTLATLLSFVNCEKYPPSLLYLAITLGPGLILLARFQAARSAWSQAIVTIGRVPFLFYVAHLFVLHAMAIPLAWVMSGSIAWLFRGLPVFGKPADYGLALPYIYALWLVALCVLYPLCRRFAAIKQRRKDWWLSYL